MPEHQFNCPRCQTLLKTSEPLPPGTKIKCPQCGCIFGAEAAAPKRASRESERPPPPLPRREPADLQPLPSPRRERERPPRYEEDYDDEPRREERPSRRSGLSRRYSINVGEWFHFAGAHYSSVVGPFIGYTLLLGLIMIPVGMIPIVNLLLLPPLFAGFNIVCLAQLKGKRWSFGDFFGGFNWFGALVGNVLLLALFVLAAALACLLPGMIVVGIAAAARAEVLAVLAVPLLLLGYCALIYIQVRASCFCQQLIFDRGYGALEAIQGSWELSRGHFWGLFGMSLLIGLIVFAGYLVCFIGVLFTAPFAALAWNAGYLLIAGSRPPVEPRDRYEEEAEYRRRFENELPHSR